MANQENAKQGIFPRVNIPSREALAPVLPRPEVRSAPVSPEPGKRPKTKKPLIQRLAQNTAVRIVLAGTAVAGAGYAAYQEIPAVHRTVDNVIGRVFGDEVPNTFDNKLDKGVIGDNNIVRMTREEIQKLPDFDKNGNPILLFPFSPPEGQAITFTKKFHGGSVHPDIEVDPETTRNSITINAKAGHQYSLFDGYMFKGNEATVLMIDIGNGEMQRVILGPDFSVPGQTEFLVDAPTLSSENGYGKDWKKGLFVLRGELVANSSVDAVFSLEVINLPEGPYGYHVEGNLVFTTSASGQLATSQG